MSASSLLKKLNVAINRSKAALAKGPTKPSFGVKRAFLQTGQEPSSSSTGAKRLRLSSKSTSPGASIVTTPNKSTAESSLSVYAAIPPVVVSSKVVRSKAKAAKAKGKSAISGGLARDSLSLKVSSKVAGKNPIGTKAPSPSPVKATVAALLGAKPSRSNEALAPKAVFDKGVNSKVKAKVPDAPAMAPTRSNIVRACRKKSAPPASQVDSDPIDPLFLEEFLAAGSQVSPGKTRGKWRHLDAASGDSADKVKELAALSSKEKVSAKVTRPKAKASKVIAAKSDACESPQEEVASPKDEPRTPKAAPKTGPETRILLSSPGHPVRRRIQQKTSSEEPNVAMLLRKLIEEEGDVEKDFQKFKTAGAEVAEMSKGQKVDGEAELDPDQKAGGKRPKPTGTQGASNVTDGQDLDDDKLFDDNDDDLEGEEVISDLSEPEVMADEVADFDEDWVPVDALRYPSVWKMSSDAPQPRPGEVGFNEYAKDCILRAGLGTSESPFAGLGMRLHQESAAFLAHPESPLNRILVDHATGTGKTLIMIRVLDNYFDDPRPKVAIFPKDRVCDNFFMELLKWPSRWRDYFCANRPNEAALASGAANWKRKRGEIWDQNNERLRTESKRRNVRLEKILQELVECARDVLEMKNSIRAGRMKPGYAQVFMKEHPGVPVPRAPLRAFRYTTAGGGACEVGSDGWPRSPILKVGFDKRELNPYSNKVVLMDEVHNLVRPTKKYEEQLGRLRDHLSAARNLVLLGTTGTPVGNEADEGRMLLDTIKGDLALQCCDEGFVTSFHARASSDFPREVPVQGVPDGVIHEGMFDSLVKKHSLHGEALKRYLLKEVEFQIVPRILRLPVETRMSRLANYCNLHVHYGHCYGTHKADLMADLKGHAPKMHAIVKSICKKNEKVVVLLTREMGFKLMLEVLRKAGKKSGFRVATMEELGDFNDAKRNLRGERFRVLLAETSQAGEGVQFRHVRRVHLMDVPLRHSELVQRVSRCVRMGGHKDLPEEERELAIEVHCAQLPKFLRQGPGALIYRELLNHKDSVTMPGTLIENATVACLETLNSKNVKTLSELATLLQAEEGGKEMIDLLTETALEAMRSTSPAPARLMAMALWRLRKGGDDLEVLDKALRQQVRTADEILLDWLVDKCAELLPPLEVMRFGAVDRPLLAQLGDPPRAPPPKTEASRKKLEKASKKLAPIIAELAPKEEVPLADLPAVSAGQEEEDLEVGEYGEEEEAILAELLEQEQDDGEASQNDAEQDDDDAEGDDGGDEAPEECASI